jgi:hypothetical protein
VATSAGQVPPFHITHHGPAPWTTWAQVSTRSGATKKPEPDDFTLDSSGPAAITTVALRTISVMLGHTARHYAATPLPTRAVCQHGQRSGCGYGQVC